MQQTTYGETHKKTKVFNRQKVDNYIKENSLLYKKLENSQNCLYSNSLMITSDIALNYLNSTPLSLCESQLKSIMLKEFKDCEKLYPYLGDYLVDKYFNSELNSQKERESCLFDKDLKDELIGQFKFKETKLIADWVFKNATKEYSISIEKSKGSKILVRKDKLFNFDVEYDYSYLGNKKFHKMVDYKFLIIDGQIESIGEIHHLLETAASTKVPHIVFCSGLSPDVENIIKFNNSKSKFEVFPVVIKLSEKTINTLNDIAVALNEEIVSASKGQTVSLKVKNSLKTGKQIIFHKNGFSIMPECDNVAILQHRNFLKKRIEETLEVENKKLIKERLKMFSSKSIKIYIPEEIFKNNDLIREFDYFFRFLNSTQERLIKLNIADRMLFIPATFIDFANKKIESLENIYNNISKLIVSDENARR